MNRPVPEGHMTSPPQSVSIPRTASATNRPVASIDPSSNWAADTQTNVCATREALADGLSVRLCHRPSSGDLQGTGSHFPEPAHLALPSSPSLPNQYVCPTIKGCPFDSF